MLGKAPDLANNGANGTAGTKTGRRASRSQVGGSGGQFWKYATGSSTTVSSNPFCGDPQHVYPRTDEQRDDREPDTQDRPAERDWNGWHQSAYFGARRSGVHSPDRHGCQSSTRTTSAITAVDRRASTSSTTSSGYQNLPPSRAPLQTTRSGELSLGSPEKILTSRGTIFIDGSLYDGEHRARPSTDGQDVIYVSGTFLNTGSGTSAPPNARATTALGGTTARIRRGLGPEHRDDEHGRER